MSALGREERLEATYSSAAHAPWIAASPWPASRSWLSSRQVEDVKRLEMEQALWGFVDQCTVTAYIRRTTFEQEVPCWDDSLSEPYPDWRKQLASGHRHHRPGPALVAA